MDAAVATLIGTGMTALVSLAALFLNYRVSKYSIRSSIASAIGGVSLELKIQQLNELYGPLVLLLEQNRRLAEKLREDKGASDWRLLDHLPGIMENPADRAVVEAILEIDAKIENLLITKGGLVHGSQPPESFEHFLGHYKFLKLAAAGEERPRVGAYEYYPIDFNDDVEASYKAIRKEIDDMVHGQERLLKEASRA